MIDAVNAVLMPVATGGMAVPVTAAAPADALSTLPVPATPMHGTAQGTGLSTVPGTPALTPVPLPSAGMTASPVPVESAAAAPPSRPTNVAAPPAPAPASAPAPTAVVAAPAPASAAPAPAVPAKLEVSVAAAALRGWPLKVSGSGSTGKVNGVMVGLPDGHVTGLTAHFGGFLGFGGRNIFVPWDRVTPDAKAHLLRAKMTAAESAAAPAGPAKP